MPRLVDSLRHAALAAALLAACRGDRPRAPAALVPFADGASCPAPSAVRASLGAAAPTHSTPGAGAEEER